jgi:hypothetical protein
VPVRVDAGTGEVSWSSPDVDLQPVGTLRTLAVMDALRLLATTIAGAVPSRADGKQSM